MLISDFLDTIKEWDRKSGRCLHTFEGHSGYMYNAIYSPDGKRVLSVSSDESIKEWDSETEKCLQTIPSGEKSTAVYCSDGQRIFTLRVSTADKLSAVENDGF